MIGSDFLGLGSKEIYLTRKEQEKTFWVLVVFYTVIVVVVTMTGNIVKTHLIVLLRLVSFILC